MTNINLPHDHGQFSSRALEQMPETGDFQTIAEIFKQLADGNLHPYFLAALPLRRMCDQSFCHGGHVQPGCEPHLKQLKGAQLITSRREGKEVYYRAADNDRAQLLHHMIEQMIDIACPNEQH